MEVKTQDKFKELTSMTVTFLALQGYPLAFCLGETLTLKLFFG